MKQKKDEKNKLSLLVGQNISKRRKELNLTQVELAKILQIKQESLSRMEKGRIAPKFSRLEDIAHALDINITDLFTNKNNSPLNEKSLFFYRLSKLDKKYQDCFLTTNRLILIAVLKDYLKINKNLNVNSNRF